jgi:PAS domain S-box-containing protein
MRDQSKTKQALIQELSSLRKRITELEQSESERKRLDDVLRLDSEILANMMEGVNLTRADDGVIVYINPCFESMFGYDPGELVGKHISIVNATGDKSPEAVTNEIIKSLKQAGEWHGEVHNLRKNGVSFWCYANVSKFKHPQYGEVWISVHQDITDLKQAEEAVKKSETKYRRLHESLMDGFVFVGMDGIIKEYNKSFLEMIGYTREEILKLTYRDLTPEKWHSFEQNIVEWQILTQGYSEVYEKEYRKKDGTVFPVELRTFLIKDETGSNIGMWAIVRDITARKRAEDIIKASLREKDILLREIHHRVKNNLQVISGLLELQASSIGNPELTGMLNQSQSRIQAMALVHEKLYASKDFARIDCAGYVGALSQDLFQSHKINAGKIDLIIQTDGVVYVDINKAIPCGLILNELISNAIKHAFPGDRKGKLQIIIGETKNTEIEIIVRDNGLGLPGDVDIHDSRSLGLDLVNGLVKNQLDGQIEVRRDNGTEFRIKFPL